jgi:rare lipoprotein A
MFVFQHITIGTALLLTLYGHTQTIAPKTTAESIPSVTKPQNNRKSSRLLYGQASYYASKFEGRKTANGEIFRHAKLTAACNSLPLGTWIKVTNLKNGKSVVVKTNDRLHPKTKRLVDLTSTAAQKLGFIKSGLTRVKVEVLSKKPA